MSRSRRPFPLSQSLKAAPWGGGSRSTEVPGDPEVPGGPGLGSRQAPFVTAVPPQARAKRLPALGPWEAPGKQRSRQAKHAISSEGEVLIICTAVRSTSLPPHAALGEGPLLICLPRDGRSGRERGEEHSEQLPPALCPGLSLIWPFIW